ncbi:SphA family protein [Pseudomonas frederiksbergensis]|uniref:SphA family protein n=1 Tax=Pseudomonas frederiksbergensis TaxID=104087 RepID=UPI0030B972E4
MKTNPATRPQKIQLINSAVVLGMLSLIQSSYATEGGGTVYPLGVNTVLAGRMPPPGLTGFLYLSDYQANKTMDDSGNRKAGVHDFEINVQAISARLDYVYTDYTLLGAKLASRIALPMIKGDISFDVNTSAGRVHRSDNQQGIGDLTIVPIILGWSSPLVQQMTGVEIYAPIGAYDKEHLFNPGRNTWSYAPWYSFTAYPVEDIEISSKIAYVVNTENSATHYKSGQEFIADYNIGYNIDKQWQIGLNGYIYKQLTDDEQHGESVSPNGNRGQVLAVGPSVKYQSSGVGFVLKWQHETKVENRAAGDRLWLQAAYHF